MNRNTLVAATSPYRSCRPESSAAPPSAWPARPTRQRRRTTPSPDSGIVAVPQTKAQPAAEAYPGAWWDRHHPSLVDPSTASQFIAPFE